MVGVISASYGHQGLAAYLPMVIGSIKGVGPPFFFPPQFASENGPGCLLEKKNSRLHTEPFVWRGDSWLAACSHGGAAFSEPLLPLASLVYAPLSFQRRSPEDANRPALVC